MDLRITPIDDEAVNQGTWTVYRGVKLRIARANNDKFARIFTQLSKPHKREIDNNTADEETLAEIMAESLGQGILTDWSGFVLNGEEIPYSTENAISLMRADADCRAFVMEFAGNVEHYLQKQEDYIEKK
jgi:hypothetical protein